MLTKAVMLSCVLFTSCSKDIDDPVVDVNAGVVAKSLYFYGSDAEFDKLQYGDMKHITNDGELANIMKSQNAIQALFVGNKIDVRTGIVDDLRNAGVLVTQLEEEVTTQKELSPHATLIKGGTFNPENALSTEKSLEDELLLTTYISVNGNRTILGGIYDNMEQAVPHILQWGEKKIEENKDTSIGKSGNKVRKKAINWDFTWGGLANFSIDTEVYQADTDGYMLDDGTGNQEYPDIFIYDHKVSVRSTNSSYNVNDIQVIQTPLSSSLYDHSLREYSPLNGDNGVLNGRTGSDSFGYGINYGGGFSLTGPSINYGASFSWTHSTGWSIPACQVKTHHDPSVEKFHVQYDIDPFGAWNNQSVAAENYTYYASSEFANYIAPSYYRVPITYFFDLYAPSQGLESGQRSLYIYMNSNSQMDVTLYHRGYFGNGRSTTAPGYSW